jgi:GNAT superfamily N-acetyltransferase
MKLAFRQAESADDRKFAISSWLDATRFTQSCGLIQMDDFYPVMWPQYEKALARDGMSTVIAYEQDDPQFLYGFMSADPGDQRIPQHDGSVRWYPGLVLFVFVKQNFRREGIARRLFDAVGINPGQPFLYASNTPQASRLESKFPKAKYNQLAARFPKERRA